MSGADSALVEARLRRSVEAGQLELHEFGERARLAWAARTRGELDAVSQDLGELPRPDLLPTSVSSVGTVAPRWRYHALGMGRPR